MSQPRPADATPAIETRSPPIPTPIFEYLINPLIKAILKSPAHGLLSHALLLITFTGRKSGRTYTTPVGYEELDDGLYITSQTDRVWWKNLRGGAEVSLRLRGRSRDGFAEVIEDDDAVADYVLGFIDRHGLESVNRLALSIEGDEVPDKETLAAGLTDTVVVRVELV